MREREGVGAGGRRGDEWTTARAAAHVALAQRGSRLALYDLRESLERAAPLPVEFLTALSLIGDASCLEPIAGRAREGDGTTLVARPPGRRVSRDRRAREASRGGMRVMKKIEKKWQAGSRSCGREGLDGPAEADR